MTNLNLLHVFWEVAKTKNITRASENLYVSQPAVSASIKELEKIYGKQLFIRKNKGIELNYFGQKLFNQIDISMKNLSNVDKFLSTFEKQEKGYIRIATNTSNLNKLISDEMIKFIADFPEVDLSVSRLNEEEIVEKSKNGEYDIVFLDGEFDKNQFKEINKLTIEYKVIGNKTFYNKYKDNPMTLDDLKNEKLILSNKTYTSRKNIDDFFEKHNIALSPKYELDGYSYISDFLILGVGMSILNPFYYLNYINNEELFIIPTTFSLDRRDIHLLQPIINNSDNYCQEFITQLSDIDLSNAD